MQGLTTTGTGVAALGGMIDPFTAIPTMLSQSPRLVGETVFKLGQASNLLGRNIPRVATAGRIARPLGLLQNQNQALENRGLLQ